MKTTRKRQSRVLVCFSSIIACFLMLAASVESGTAERADRGLYYYTGEGKTSLPLSREMVAVRFKREITLEQKRAVVESEKDLEGFSEEQQFSDYELILLTLQEGVSEESIIQTTESLNRKPEIEFATPVFHFPDTKLILTDEFIVKFAPSVSTAEIEAFNRANNVEIARKRDA